MTENTLNPSSNVSQKILVVVDGDKDKALGEFLCQEFKKSNTGFEAHVSEFRSNGEGLIEKELSDASEYLRNFSPQLLLVVGQSKTALTFAMAAAYDGVKSGHLDVRRPESHYESVNSRVIKTLATYHFVRDVKSLMELTIKGVATDNITVIPGDDETLQARQIVNFLKYRVK